MFTIFLQAQLRDRELSVNMGPFYETIILIIVDSVNIGIVYIQHVCMCTHTAHRIYGTNMCACVPSTLQNLNIAYVCVALHICTIINTM